MATQDLLQCFDQLDIRVGTIRNAYDFPKARKPAFKLEIDFGEAIGVMESSAQITDLYTIDGLIGKQVLAVVNFAPRQIADFSGFYEPVFSARPLQQRRSSFAGAR